MYHIRLKKGLSYADGIVTASKEKPDIFVEDADIAKYYEATGFFEYKGEVSPKSLGKQRFTEDADDLMDDDLFTEPESEDDGDFSSKAALSDELGTKSIKELKTYAGAIGADISGLSKKEDIIAKIVEFQNNTADARAALREE